MKWDLKHFDRFGVPHRRIVEHTLQTAEIMAWTNEPEIVLSALYKI